MTHTDNDSISSRYHDLDEEQMIDDNKPVEIIYQDRVRQWLNESKVASDISPIGKFSAKPQHYLALKESARRELENFDANLDGVSGCFVFLPFYKLKRRSS